MEGEAVVQTRPVTAVQDLKDLFRMLRIALVVRVRQVS